MTHPHNEDCPVCWRGFGTEVVPFSIPCGHSFCSECAGGLRHCPLCRKKLVSGYPRSKNYSLLSLLDRVNQVKPIVETRDQETQTSTRKPSSRPRLEPDGQPVKRGGGGGQSMNLKFVKGDDNSLKQLVIKFK